MMLKNNTMGHRAVFLLQEYVPVTYKKDIKESMAM